MVMKSANWIVFGSAVCAVLTASIVSGHQQTGEPSGIRGLPVEGHDIVAGLEIVGTKHIDSRALRERLRPNGAELRLGWPLESQTLCRFKEVLRDVLAEKGFVDAEVTHDTRPTRGNRQHLTLTFTISEGSRSRAIHAPASPTPAERCAR
jgi:outer membrane protein assembly factor BamA